MVGRLEPHALRFRRVADSRYGKATVPRAQKSVALLRREGKQQLEVFPIVQGSLERVVLKSGVVRNGNRCRLHDRTDAALRTNAIEVGTESIADVHHGVHSDRLCYRQGFANPRLELKVLSPQ